MAAIVSGNLLCRNRSQEGHSCIQLLFRDETIYTISVGHAPSPHHGQMECRTPISVSKVCQGFDENMQTFFLAETPDIQQANLVGSRMVHGRTKSSNIHPVVNDCTMPKGPATGSKRLAEVFTGKDPLIQIE